MNPENVLFVSSIVCHVLCFACQWKPSGGQDSSYPLPLNLTKPVGVSFLHEVQVKRKKFNLKN